MHNIFPHGSNAEAPSQFFCASTQADGLSSIAGGLAASSSRVQRKAAHFLTYILLERPELRGPAAAAAAATPGTSEIGGGGAAAALPALLGNSDRQTREAALRLALALAGDASSAEALFQVQFLFVLLILSRTWSECARRRCSWRWLSLKVRLRQRHCSR